MAEDDPSADLQEAALRRRRRSRAAFTTVIVAPVVEIVYFIPFGLQIRSLAQKVVRSRPDQWPRRRRLRRQGERLHDEGQIALEQHRLNEARDKFERALMLSQEAQAWRLEGESLVAVAEVHRRSNNVEESIAYLYGAVDLFGDHRDVRQVAMCMVTLGAVYKKAADEKAAADCFTDAIETARKIDSIASSPSGVEAHIHYLVATNLLEIGHGEAALPYFIESKRLIRNYLGMFKNRAQRHAGASELLLRIDQQLTQLRSRY